EPDPGPRSAGVGRLVDAVTDRDVAANPLLARADPHDVRIGGRHSDGANRLRRLAVEDWLPVKAAVDRFPETARRSTGVVDVRVARDAGDRGHAIADRTDVPPFERVQRVAAARLRLREARRQGE